MIDDNTIYSPFFQMLMNAQNNQTIVPMAAPIQTARSNVRVTQAICSLKTDIRANVEVYSRKLAAVSQLLAGQFHTHSKTLSVNGSLI